MGPLPNGLGDPGYPIPAGYYAGGVKTRNLLILSFLVAFLILGASATWFLMAAL